MRRSQVLEALNVSGLKDPHGYLPKELDQWDVWNLDDSDRGSELRRLCKEWLDRYVFISSFTRNSRASSHVL